MQDVQKFLKKFRNFMIVFSVVYLIVGIALLIQPQRMSNLLGLLIGIIAFIIGVYRLISYFRDQRLDSMLATDLFIGICLMISGFLCIIFYDRVLTYAPIILAFIFVAGGVMKLQNAVNMQKLGYDIWWISVLLAIISLGGAVLAVVRPAFIENHFLGFVAVMFIYEAVSGIATLVMAEKYYSELRKNPQLAFAGHVRAEAFAASAFGARADVPAIGTSADASEEHPAAEVVSGNEEGSGSTDGAAEEYAAGNSESAPDTAYYEAEKPSADQEAGTVNASEESSVRREQNSDFTDNTANSAAAENSYSSYNSTAGDYTYHGAGFDDSEVIASASFEPAEPKQEKKSRFEFLKFWKKKDKAEEPAPDPFEAQGYAKPQESFESQKPVQESYDTQETVQESEQESAEAQDEEQVQDTEAAAGTAGTIQDEVIRTADAQEAQYHPLDDDPFSSNPTNDASMPGVSFDADGAKDAVPEYSASEDLSKNADTAGSEEGNAFTEDAGSDSTVSDEDDRYSRYMSDDEPLD